MFTHKRQLKKDKSKTKVKYLIFFLFFGVVIILLLEFFYFNYIAPNKILVTPMARNNNSKIMDLESQLYKQSLIFSSVSSDAEGNFVINLKDGGVVILSSKKDIKSQLSSLQLVLSRLTIEGKKLKSLDLRYDSPIISF